MIVPGARVLRELRPGRRRCAGRRVALDDDAAVVERAVCASATQAIASGDVGSIAGASTWARRRPGCRCRRPRTLTWRTGAPWNSASASSCAMTECCTTTMRSPSERGSSYGTDVDALRRVPVARREGQRRRRAPLRRRRRRCGRSGAGIRDAACTRPRRRPSPTQSHIVSPTPSARPKPLGLSNVSRASSSGEQRRRDRHVDVARRHDG